jgi:aspartate/glutamate racemase
MDSTKKYVLATIKIPMEVNDDGTCNPLHDYLNVDITKLELLPSKSNKIYNNDFLTEQIQLLFPNDTQQEDLNNFIENAIEIKSTIIEKLTDQHSRNHKRNQSFKNKKHKSSRYSLKNHNYFDLASVSSRA